MPTYAYKCTDCGTETTRINRIANHQTGAPFCCEKQTKQIITPMTMGSRPIGASVFEAYRCPATDEVILNAKDKVYNEKKNDLIVSEPGMGLSQSQRKSKREEVVNFKDHIPDDLKPELKQELNNFQQEIG